MATKDTKDTKVWGGGLGRFKVQGPGVTTFGQGWTQGAGGGGWGIAQGAVGGVAEREGLGYGDSFGAGSSAYFRGLSRGLVGVGFLSSET